VENSRAHRALLRGDKLYVGYTYTEDALLSQLIFPRTNYNYWLRQFDAVNGSWASPTNLSKICNRNVDAKEPRLTGTPGSGPDCPNNPQECQNSDIFFAAWGTELKDPAAGVAKDLALFITFTTDSGKEFAPAILLAGVDNVNGQAEAQLRATPDGSQVFATWIEQNRSGASDARLTVGTLENK
jgi:hypothetical protein